MSVALYIFVIDFSTKGFARGNHTTGGGAFLYFKEL